MADATARLDDGDVAQRAQHKRIAEHAAHTVEKRALWHASRATKVVILRILDGPVRRDGDVDAVDELEPRLGHDQRCTVVGDVRRSIDAAKAVRDEVEPVERVQAIGRADHEAE